MLHRRHTLSAYRYFLKSLRFLWLIAVVVIDALVPIACNMFYRLKPESCDYMAQELMFFCLPLFAVWTVIFVDEILFSESAKDVLFFLSNTKRTVISFSFFAAFFANSIIVVFLHKYCLQDVLGFAVKISCVIVFYYGLARLVLAMSKTASLTVMVVILAEIANTIFKPQKNIFLLYVNIENLTAEMFKYIYLPLLITGIILNVTILLYNMRR